MPETPQSYATHVRRHPLYHYFVAPVMLLNFIWAVVLFVRSPGWDRGKGVIVSFALVAAVYLIRTYSLKVQDRIIRLEERLRYQQLLPADLAERAGALPLPQIIALRFASDAELPELVQQVLEGKLSKPDEVKRAIKNWRADTFRV